jgi:CDP-diglyceride synthetase
VPPAPPPGKARETAVRTVAAVFMIGLFGLGMFADMRWIGFDLCFQVIVLAVSLLAVYEFFGMAAAGSHKPFVKIGVAATALLIIGTWLSLADLGNAGGRCPFWKVCEAFIAKAPWLILAVTVIALFAAAARRPDWNGAAADMGLTVLGLLYIWFLPAYFMVRIRHLGADGATNGDHWLTAGARFVCASIFTAKSSDIFAYLGGRAIGRHKMTPRLSPKKTWEGFACGLAGSTAVALLFFYVPLPSQPFLRELSCPGLAAAFGLALGLASVWGDLTASLLKRSFAVKDSGAIVPGYGGVIDVIDSLMVAGPVAFIFLKVALIVNCAA